MYRVPPTQKNGTVFLYAFTSSNINRRFSKLFHCQNQEKTCNNTITKDPTTPQVCRYTTLWNVTCLKATIENKTTPVTTHFKEINNREQRVYCLIFVKVTHMLQFYIKCLICSPCCGTTNSSRWCHWPMAPSTKSSNSLLQSVTIACFSWLIVLNGRRWSFCWRAPQAAQSTGFKSGLFGSHMWGSMNVTCRRYVGVFHPAADIRARCQRYSCRMWQLLWTITETITRCS